MPRRTKYGQVLDAIASLEAEKNEESDNDA